MRRKLVKIFLTTSIIALQLTTSIFANYTIYKENEDNTILMDGLTYKKIERITNQGFIDIHILEYDLNSSNIELEILRNNEEWSKRTPLSNMVTPEILAGVNGSFFDTSAVYTDILGFEMEDGEVVYAKNDYNRSVANSSSLNQKNDGTVSFEYISNQIIFTTENGTTVYVNSVNGMQDFENPTVFTGNVISDTTYVDNIYDLYKVIIENGQVLDIIPPKTVATIAENQIALITKDSYVVDLMPVGTSIDYKVATNLGDKLEEYEMILSGGGNILKEGEIVKDGIQVSPYLRQPRTVVGTTEDDKLIVVAVDGRGDSIGATHKEVAELLLELNVTNAIHLDGGGSTELVAVNYNNANVVQNQPSDGKERNISNGLGFLSTVQDSYLSRIELKVNNENVFIGNDIELSLIGYDQYNRPYYVDDASGIYTIEGIAGNITENKIEVLTAGIGLVKVEYGQLQAQVPINVVDTAKDITVYPIQKTINTNMNTKLNSFVTSYEDNTMTFNLNNANITLINPNMGYIFDNHFYSTGQEGIAYIQIEYAGITKQISIEVVNPFNDIKIDYSLNDSYSTKDSNFINNQVAIEEQLQEVSMFGRIEIEGMETATRVYEEILELTDNSTLRIFSGGIVTPKGMTLKSTELYKNDFSAEVYDDLSTKIINMQTFESNLSNINQLFNLQLELKNNTMKNIIIQNSSENFNYIKNTRFNELLRDTLDEYAKETGVNIYFVNGNANRKNISVDNINKVTYIQIPKIIMTETNTSKLTNDIYFYLDVDGILKYSFKN